MIGLCSCLNTRSHQGVGGASGSALGPCSARRAAASSELSPAVVVGLRSAAGEADGMIGSSYPSVSRGRTPEERVGALRDRGVLRQGRHLLGHRRGLTGESAPVARQTAALPKNTPISERANTLFGGTTVTYGRGR